MKVKASYTKIKANPFADRTDRKEIATKTVSFPDGTPMDKIEKLAKGASPRGYEFKDVKEVN
jgi:hypothetical protein